MNRFEPENRESLPTNHELRERLREAEETLAAIRQGKVDALVVSNPQGERIYTLKGADYAYRVLIETMNEGAVTLAASGMILYCNNRFAAMLKRPLEKVMGSFMADYIPPQEKPSFQDLLKEGLTAGIRGDLHLELPDGLHLPVQLSLNPLQMDESRAVCLIATDLTQRKEKEAELSAYACLLEESNQGLQEFAFVASHDLQEPLRKIQAFSDLLASRYGESLGATGLDYLARMQGAARRMQELIEALLTYSRVTTQALPFKTVDLNQVVKEALSNLDTRLKTSGGKVKVETLPTIQADPVQMVQLFQNLISNALKFHLPGETPQVRVFSAMVGGDPAPSPPPSDPPRQCRIVVADNGIGFDERYLETMFKPFQRLHGRSQYEGTGMGLSICRKIVDRHGGSLTAESRHGKGSTFIITLPLHPETGDAASDDATGGS